MVRSGREERGKQVGVREKGRDGGGSDRKETEPGLRPVLDPPWSTWMPRTLPRIITGIWESA